jgi:hypothetical protein
MGLLDFGAKVILTYKADVSDAKAKIRELSGEEKKLAQERLKQEEAANKGIERQIKGLGMLAAGIGAAMGAVALAKSGLDEYAKTSEQAAAKVKDIKTSASTAMDAVQASIGKTVVAMEPLIKSITDVVKLLGDAGAAGPLAMGALALAISGNPVIAALVLGASSGTDPADVIFNAQGYIDGKRAQAKRGAQGALDATRRFDMDPTTLKGVGDQIGNAISNAIGEGTRRGLGVSEWGKLEYKSGGKGGPDRRDARWSLDNWRQGEGGNVGGGSSGGISQGALADGVARDIYGNPTDLSAIAGGKLFDLYEERTKQWIERTQALNSGPSILERMLGPIQEIDLYRESFSMLTGAATAGYEAMIDGTMSFGDAVKKSVADALKALGSKMLVQAIGETAAGFAALASGYGIGAAAPHFKAAALYGAGAAAAGLASSALGGGGGSGGGVGASAPDSRGSSSLGGSPGQSERIIVYEDAFAENNAHERALRAEKIVRKVVGSGAVRAR